MAVLPAVAAIFTGAIAVFGWNRQVAGAREFAVFSLALFVWTFFAVFETLSVSAGPRVLFGRLQYLGIPWFGVAWLLFTLRYSQRDAWITRRRVALLAVLPLATMLIAATDPWHGLVWREVRFVLEPYPALVIEHGHWFRFVLIPYSYFLLLAGMAVLIGTLISAARRHRAQTALLLVSVLVSLGLNVAYVVAGLNIYGLDPTPLSMALASVLISFALFRFDFLRVSPVTYRTIFLNTAEAVIVLGNDDRIVERNPAGERLVPDAAVNRPLAEVLPAYQLLLDRARAEGGGTLRPLTTLIETAAGRHVEVKVRPLASPGGRLVGTALFERDVTLEREEHAQLEEAAFIDSLTGIANRRRLELAAADMLRPDRPDAKPTTLLYLDLNDFKPVNDQYGHGAGDAVLREVARRFALCLRQGDVVARLGGDEFVVLLPECDRDCAGRVEARLLATLHHPIHYGRHALSVGASVGGASFPGDGADLDDLLRHADAEMYRVKREREPTMTALAETPIVN